MAQLTIYILPVPPSANRWWRRAGRIMHKSKEAREYQMGIRDVLTHQGWTPAQCIREPRAVGISLRWHRARRAGDLDKRLGVVFDALQGLLYDNDAQIIEISAKRVDDTKIGFLEILVSRA